MELVNVTKIAGPRHSRLAGGLNECEVLVPGAKQRRHELNAGLACNVCMWAYKLLECEKAGDRQVVCPHPS